MRTAARRLSPALTDPATFGLQVAGAAYVRGLAAWSLVLGAVTAEVFEQNGPDVSTDPDAHFEAMVALAASLVFGG